MQYDVSKIKKALEDATPAVVITLWNEFCREYGDPDNCIEFMDSFNEIFSGCSPLYIVDAVSLDFNTSADFFTFDGNGHAISIWSDDVLDYVDYDELASSMSEYPRAYDWEFDDSQIDDDE